MDAIPSLSSETDAARLSDYLEFCHLISLVDYPTLSWREYLDDVQEEALEMAEDARIARESCPVECRGGGCGTSR
jgi:hypothetical protein